jgi:nitrate reductase NapE component
MRRAFQSRKLESFRLFPILAWGFVIAFTFFVYTMTMNLKSATSELKSQTNLLEAATKAPSGAKTDFEAAGARSRE